MQIGSTLKHFRTGSEIGTAQALGVSQPTYNRYEQGKAKIPFPVLLDFCSLYNISVTKFVNQMEKFKPKVQL